MSQNQLANHFKNSTCLTTKVGLLHTLQNCPFFATHFQDKNDFFPRSYDLSYKLHVQEFLDDYHCLEAETTLKRLMKRWESNSKNDMKINIGVLKTLLSVIQKCTYDANDFVDVAGSIRDQCFTLIQGRIIENADGWFYRKVNDRDLNVDICHVTSLKSLLVEKKQGEDEKTSAKHRKKLVNLLSQLELMDQYHVNMIKTTLEKGRNSGSLQDSINGTQSNNIWILKPAGKSRGRGISVEHTLSGISKHIDAASDSRNKLNHWVIQKYIENPLTIAGRKFDIRQWVMVTGETSRFFLKVRLI